MSLTWLQFKNAVKVYLHTYVDVPDIQTLIDASIAQGAADVQRVVRKYQTNHTDTYGYGDLTSTGFTYTATLPNGKITSARLVKYDTEAEVVRPNVFRTLKQIGWENFPAMRGGERSYCEGTIAINPVTRQFAISPGINSESRLYLEWDGIKTDFDDGDLTPFDERMVEVVADFVLHRIKRTVDKDIALIRSYEQSYIVGKRKLLSDSNWEQVIESNVKSQLDGDEDYEGSGGSGSVMAPLFYFRPDITALTGGTATDFDSVVTATGMATDTTFFLIIGGVQQYWRLIAGTDATDIDAGFVRPLDYHGTTNARVWQRLT